MTQKATQQTGDYATGWRRETLQLRKNVDERSAQMSDFVKIFDQLLVGVALAVSTPELRITCLALHHLAMGLRSGAGPKARKIMLGAKLSDLPKSFGFEGRRGGER